MAKTQEVRTAGGVTSQLGNRPGSYDCDRKVSLRMMETHLTIKLGSKMISFEKISLAHMKQGSKGRQSRTHQSK